MTDGHDDVGREFVARFRALDAPTPAIIRLRHLLKVALRQFNFRCLDIAEAPPSTGSGSLLMGRMLDGETLATDGSHADGAGGSDK